MSNSNAVRPARQAEALPQSGPLTLEVSPAYAETSLGLPEGLPLEQWAGIGKTLGHMYRSNRWWLTDWINYGERTYDGSMYNQYVHVCGLAPQTLSNFGWIGRKVEPSRRREESTTGLTFSHHGEIAALEPEMQNELLDRAGEEEWSHRRLRQEVRELTGGSSVHFSSDSAEWYTPPDIIDRVERALGAIELDPCADPKKTVPALNHLTEEDDGLTFEWSGKVFMNPPYGAGIKVWVEKLRKHHVDGDVPEAVALVPSRTDTAWFAMLRDYPRCFVRGRLRFSGHDNSAPFPSCAFYLGPNSERFIQAFEDLGDIFEKVGA